MSTATIMVPTEVVVKVVQDTDAESPRTFDNLGTMACWHRRYNLGDIQPSQAPDEWLKDNAPKGSVVLPLYLYDHSGITMSTGTFSCPWDSGRVGWIVVTPERLRKEYSCKRISKRIRELATKVLVQEVKTYDNFLTGNVWGYDIETKDGEHIDSCFGFFGDDLASTGLVEQAGNEYKDALAEAWEHRF